MKLINERNYETEMQTKVLPLLNSVIKTGKIKCSDAELYYEYFINDKYKKNMIIVHGFTENIVKYYEVAYYFYISGFNVFIYEQRGHGRSTRFIDNMSAVYVKQFDEYVDDLYCFINNVVNVKTKNLESVIFAHSLGGGVTARFLEKYPDIIKKAVLTSPMIAPKTFGIPEWIALLLVYGAIALGKDKEPILLKKDYQEEKFETSGDLSRERFEYAHEQKIAEPLFRMSNSTYGFAKESYSYTRNLLKTENLAKIKAKVLLFQAGLDYIVKPEPQIKFINGIKHGELVVVPNSKHEIYNCENADLQNYYDKIFNFLNN